MGFACLPFGSQQILESKCVAGVKSDLKDMRVNLLCYLYYKPFLVILNHPVQHSTTNYAHNRLEKSLMRIKFNRLCSARERVTVKEPDEQTVLLPNNDLHSLALRLLLHGDTTARINDPISLNPFLL